MALIACHECGAQISSDAIKCPKCGATNKTVVTMQWVYLLAVAACIAAIIIASVLMG